VTAEPLRLVAAPPQPVTTCARCGKEFPGGNGKFCSAFCWLLTYG